jgi:DNA-binding NarL/FixJ family response regulator
MHRKQHWTPAGVPFMTAPERDAKIVELANRGWTMARIAKAVGMSRGGVEFALERIAEGRPGRDPRG